MDKKPKPERPESINGDPFASYVDSLLTWREEDVTARFESMEARLLGHDGALRQIFVTMLAGSGIALAALLALVGNLVARLL